MNDMEPNGPGEENAIRPPDLERCEMGKGYPWACENRPTHIVRKQLLGGPLLGNMSVCEDHLEAIRGRLGYGFTVEAIS